MKRINLTLILLPFLWVTAWAQPVIKNISTANLYPKGRITITGTGFSDVADNLRVVFGHANGKIITCSEFTIEVEVPPAAKLSNIEVINTSTAKMTKSAPKFMPSFYGNGFDPAGFAAPISFTSSQALWDIASADFNSDGLPDIITTKFNAGSDILVMKNITAPATPDVINFTKETSSTGYLTNHISTGDVDGDGRIDIVLTKGGSSNRNIFLVMLNASTSDLIKFSAPFLLAMDAGSVANQTSVRDLNGDGRPEIVASNALSNVLYIFPNSQKSPGTNPFITPIKITINELADTYGLDVQDFDGDGLADILVNPSSAADYYLLRNKSTSVIEFDAPVKVAVPQELRNISTADFNNDGKLDIVGSSTNTNAIVVLFNNSSSGSFSFSEPLTMTPDEKPWGISTSDIDGDLDADIIVSHQTTASINIFINNGGATPTFTKNAISISRPGRNHISGDLNGDGKPDLAFAGEYSTATQNSVVEILRNKMCHKPVILNESPLYVCNNPIKLEAIPALNVNFEWKSGATSVKNSTDPFVEINAAGTYTVTATTISPAGECSLTSTSFTVNSSTGVVPADPVLTAPAKVCSGGSISLSTDAVASASYIWKGPNEWTQTTSTNTISITSSTESAGLYTVQVTNGNCKSNVSASKIVDVVVLDDFTITSNSPTNSACMPNSVKLSVNTVSNFTYAWKKDGGAYSTPSAVSTYDAIENGSYYVKVENSGLGCSQEVGPVAVAIFTNPAANFTTSGSLCANASIQFTNTSQIDPNGAPEGIAPAQFAWVFGDGKTSSEKDPKNSFASAGTYNVQLTVSYLGVTGCTHSTTLPVIIAESTVPVITATPQSICAGETSTISVTPEFQSLTWDSGATGSTITTTQPGTYTVTATDAGGCVISKSIIIESKETPTIEVTTEKDKIPAGQSTQLLAAGAHTFDWTPEESLNNPHVPDPIASPTETTTYTVTGRFDGGCSATATITITVDGSAVTITPPVAFSPNGDGPNDLWVIDGVEKYSDCTLSIFDARGRRIYQKTGYTNDWDGTYQGKPVPDGTYYYVFSCPAAQPLTGSVLVFR